MRKSEIRSEVRQMLAQGSLRRDVYTHLRGQGLSDRRLALYIGARLSPYRWAKWRWLAWLTAAIVAGLMCLNVWDAYQTIQTRYPSGDDETVILVVVWTALAILLLIPIGMAAGRNGAYTIYVALSCYGLFKGWRVFLADPVALAAQVAVIAAVCVTAYLLRPNAWLIGPRKVNGSYVFTEDPYNGTRLEKVFS